MGNSVAEKNLSSQIYHLKPYHLKPANLHLKPAKARNNRTKNFENMVMSFYQELIPECKIESLYTIGKQKKIDCFHVDGYCDHCKTAFEDYHFCLCQKTRPSLSEQNIKRGT